MYRRNSRYLRLGQTNKCSSRLDPRTSQLWHGCLQHAFARLRSPASWCASRPVPKSQRKADRSRAKGFWQRAWRSWICPFPPRTGQAFGGDCTFQANALAFPKALRYSIERMNKYFPPQASKDLASSSLATVFPFFALFVMRSGVFDPFPRRNFAPLDFQARQAVSHFLEPGHFCKSHFVELSLEILAKTRPHVMGRPSASIGALFHPPNAAAKYVWPLHCQDDFFHGDLRGGGREDTGLPHVRVL